MECHVKGTSATLPMDKGSGPDLLSQREPRLTQLWIRAKQHKVWQWAIAYTAGAFAVLQGVDIVASAFHWPETGVRAATLILFLGFPFAVVLAWYHGHKGQQTLVRSELAVLLGLMVFSAGVVWFLAPSGDIAPSLRAVKSATTEPPSPPERSVAVMPFSNLSGDANDDYLAEGFAEELLNTLVGVRELRVAARTSSFMFKNEPADVQAIGRKLNVRAILEGSVRKAERRLRISVQLVNAETGFHLWSETYDRQLEDVLTLQSEIASSVARTLRVTLLNPNDQNVRDGSTQNPEAFDFYLQGLKLSYSAAQSEMTDALQKFDRAIEIDPQYALAYAGRAELISALVNEWIEDPIEARTLLADAMRSAEAAIRLAPNSGQAYGALTGVLLLTTNEYQKTEETIRKAVELEPGNAALQRRYARIRGSFGRNDALQAANRAVALNPLDPASFRYRGLVQFFSGDLDAARESANDALQLSADPINRLFAAQVEIAAKRPEAALKLLQDDILSPDPGWETELTSAMAYALLGRAADSERLVAKVRAQWGDVLAYQYAETYAQMGKRSEAITWLTRAVAIRDPGLLTIRVDPFLDPIRHAPAFAKLMRESKVP